MYNDPYSMSAGGMNKRLKVLIAAVLLPLGVLIPFLSLESHYSTQTSAQSTDSALEQRKEQYRAKLQADISKAQQDRLKLRCSVVQANVKNLAGRLGEIQTKRTTAYDAILGELNALVTLLDTQGVDTTNLKTDVTSLSDKVTTYKTQMTAYKQAVDDMTVIDCSQDPVSFQAALNVARSEHDALVTTTGDIRTYITNTIKPALQTMRTQIETGQITGGTQ